MALQFFNMGGASSGNNAANFVNFVTPLPLIMYRGVAVAAYKLKVIPCQRDCWVMDVRRIYVRLVVDDYTRLDDSFAQTDLAQVLL
jgi:hypothetical protein